MTTPQVPVGVRRLPGSPHPNPAVPTVPTAATVATVPLRPLTPRRRPTMSRPGPRPTAGRGSPNNVREASTDDLYVRSDEPNRLELEWQYAAFWSPRLPMGPKIEVTYGGEAARPALEQVMQTSQMYDFFSLKAASSPVPTSPVTA